MSVIIPIYNKRECLEHALNSAMGQSLREIEILCIDDGSTDGSLEVLMEASDYDPRVRVIR